MSNITQKWVELLIPFTSGYSEKYTQTELSKLAKIPQQTASRLLAKLVKQNLLNYEIQGKNKLFYFDLRNRITKNILEIIENQKAITLKQRLKNMAIIIDDILDCSETVIVFGSYSSYKNNKNSDLDIIVLGKHTKSKIKLLKSKYQVQINEHHISYEKFTELLQSKNPLTIEIMKNHTIFGNVSKIVDIFIEVSK
jgi:predicted nucleotidyltransferase